MFRIDNKNRIHNCVKNESVSRKIFRRLRYRSGVRGSLLVRKGHQSGGVIKKLPQKWRWRWNRKSSNVWKQARFLNKFNVNGLQIIRISKYFRVKRELDNLLMWRYRYNRANLRFNSLLLIGNRLDQILVVGGGARNITEARLRLLQGDVIVNGEVNFNYNAMIVANDIIQLRDNNQFIISLSRILFNGVSARSLAI